MSLLEDFRTAAKEIADDVVQARRTLHADPELSFQEERTSAFVQQWLKAEGIPYTTGHAGTGVIGVIEGNGNKEVALRADLDALPIQEENTVDYRSKNEGVMHACGHDVHTSSLLGCARVLNQFKEHLPGKVKLIFQPGEEKIPGGAKKLLEEGAFGETFPSAIFGQHVSPDMQAGKIGFRSGMYMASADEIYLEIRGKGGHAGLPHLNIDPVIITSAILLELQQIVSRHARPDTPTVLSFGRVEALGATNVIPDKVNVAGTFRTMDEEWRAKALQLIEQKATGIAKAHGAECIVNIGHGYPFLTNDPATANLARKSAAEFVGEENIVDLDLRMTAEDFAYYGHHMPACFYRLGTSNAAKGIGSGLHTSTFNIDEDVLGTSTGLMAWMAYKALG